MVSLFPYPYFSSILPSVFINILNQFFDNFWCFQFTLSSSMHHFYNIDLYKKKSIKFHHILNSILY